MKNVLLGLAFLPIILAMFPIPLVFPIALVWLCIDQPEETPLAIIYFTWLTAGIIFTFCNDRQLNK